MGIENNLHSLSFEQLKKKRKIVIAEVDIEEQARDIAEEKLTASKTELNGFRGFFKKIWKHNLAREYYRQKEIAQAKREIQESRNLYVGEGGDNIDHENAMKAIMERFEMEYDVENSLRKDEERKILHDRVPEEKTVKNIVIDLIKKYAGGNITEEQFNQEKSKLFEKELGAVKNENNNNLIKRGSLYADNLLETAKQIKNSIAHGKGLEALDLDFDIVLGKAKVGVETKPQYNAVDRITEKIQKSFVGGFVNEATVASAVAIIYGTAVKGSVNAAQKAAKWVGPVGLGLSAGIGGTVAGIRENKRVKEERAQHIREMAKGKKIEAGSSRREEMEKFRYETRNAAELTSDIRGALQKLKDDPAKENLENLLARINEIDSRIAFSERESIDLISFSDAKKVEQERTGMYIATAEAKAYLKKNIGSDWSVLYKNEQEFKDYLSQAKEAKIQNTFKKEQTLKDEAFAKMKKKKVAGAVVKGIGIGLGVGIVAQEIQAALGGSSEGLLDAKDTRASDQVRHFTSLEYLRRYISGEMPRMDASRMNEIALGADTVGKLPKGLGLAENADGTYAIAREGSEEVLFSGIRINPDGTLAEESRKLMEEKGIFADSFKSQIEEFKQVKVKEYIDGHKDLFSEIKRGSWADNDSVMPDKNELKLLWGGGGDGIDADGNYVFNVKNMTPEGSFHKGADWNPQELIKEGKMKLLISLSKDTQGQVIEIPIDANGNAIIDPNSEIGKMAFKNIDGKASFIGKFAEVAIVDSKNGADYAHVLATHTGEGMKNISSIQTKDINTLVFDAPADYDVGSPYVIPIAGRRPLEKLAGGNKDEINKQEKNMKEKMPIEYIPSIPPVEQPKADISAERIKMDMLKGFLNAVVAKEKSAQQKAAVGPMVIRNNDTPARMAAWHTLHKLETTPNLTYADLLTSTMEKGDKKFLELTRNLWTELTIHGFKKFDSGTGAWTIEKRADLDAYSCLKLMELAGIKVDMDKVNFVAPGDKADSGIIMDTSKEQHGVIAEENGKRVVIDHHGKESDRSTSATKFVYETLVEMGLLEKKEHLDKYVEFVTRCDNFNFPEKEVKKIYDNYARNLYGLSAKMKTEDILELFEKRFDPAIKLSDDYLKNHNYFNPSLKKEEPLLKLAEFFEKQMRSGEQAVKDLEKAGFVIDTGDDRFGKVLIDTKKKNGKGNWYPKVDGENKSNQLAAFLNGFGAYLIWSPQENSFVIYTKNKMDESSIPGGFSQGFNVRGNMWLKPNQDGEKLTLTLEEVLSKLDGKDFKIKGKLKEALDREAKTGEMIALIDDNKLTEDILRKTAKGLNISLNNLLFDLIMQTGQSRNVDNGLAGKNKKDPSVLESVRLEVLLKYQNNKNNNGKTAQAPISAPTPVSTAPAAPTSTPVSQPAQPAAQPAAPTQPPVVAQPPAPKAPLQGPAMPKGADKAYFKKHPNQKKLLDSFPGVYKKIEEADGWGDISSENKEEFAAWVLKKEELRDEITASIKKLNFMPDLEERIKTHELYLGFKPVLAENRFYFDYDLSYNYDENEVEKPLDEIKKSGYDKYFENLEKAPRWGELNQKSQENVAKYLVNFFKVNPYELENLKDIPIVFEVDQEKDDLKKDFFVKNFSVSEEVSVSGQGENKSLICQILLGEEGEKGNIKTSKRISEKERRLKKPQDGVLIEALRTHSNKHRSQDNYLVHTFTADSGEKVSIGVVSDGISTGRYGTNDPAHHPELGARWFTRQFCELVEKEYKNGLREKELVKKVALDLAEGMKKYQPQDKNSGLREFPDKASSELSASVIGFIIDEKNCSILTAKDGCIILNGEKQDIREKSDPVNILGESDWEKNLEKHFSFANIPTGSIQNFGITTDGLIEDVDEYPQIFKEDGSLASMSSYLGNKYHAKWNSDDKTIILISKFENGKLAKPKKSINFNSVMQKINK